MAADVGQKAGPLDVTISNAGTGALTGLSATIVYRSTTGWLDVQGS